MNNPWKERLGEQLSEFINYNSNYNLPNNANIDSMLMILNKNNPQAMNVKDFKYFAVAYAGNGPTQLKNAFFHQNPLITNNMRSNMVKNTGLHNRNMLLKSTIDKIHKKKAVSKEDLHRVKILITRNIAKSQRIQNLIKNEVMGSRGNSGNRAQLVNLLAKYMTVNASTLNALQKKGLPTNIIRRIYRK